MRSRTTWFRRTVAAFLGTGALLGGLTALATAAPPNRSTASKDLVTFGLGPSDGTKVDGRPYFYYAAAPGAVMKDHVVVLNYSVHTLHLSLYATDGFNSPSGVNSLLQANESPRDLGAWTHVSLPTRLIDVPGRKSQFDPPGQLIAPFVVAVPRGAAPGDHVAGLVVSLRTYARNAQGFSIPIDQRVATQIFMRVAGPLDPRLRVEGLKTHYLGTWNPLGTGRVRVSYTVHNVGNVRLGASQEVSVSGPIGSWSSAHLPDIPLLVPGGSAHVETVVKGVWPEVWMPGRVRVSALKLQTDVNPVTQGAGASTHFWAIPWTLVLIVAAALVYGRGRRWFRRRQGPVGDVPSGDALPTPPVEPSVPAEADLVTAGAPLTEIAPVVSPEPLVEVQPVPTVPFLEGAEITEAPEPPIWTELARARDTFAPTSGTDPGSVVPPHTEHPQEPLP